MAGSAKDSALFKDKLDWTFHCGCPLARCFVEWEIKYTDNVKDNLLISLAMARLIQAHMRGHEIDCKLTLDRYDSMEENSEDEKKDS